MSRMSELSAQQDVLDMINPSKQKRDEWDLFVILDRLCKTDDAELVREGVTAARLRTLKLMLDEKQMTLYAQEQKEREDGPD